MLFRSIKSKNIINNSYHHHISLGHTEAVTGLAFDATGNNLASCSADMSAKLWDLATYSCVKTLKVTHTETLRHSSNCFECSTMYILLVKCASTLLLQ